MAKLQILAQAADPRRDQDVQQLRVLVLVVIVIVAVTTALMVPTLLRRLLAPKSSFGPGASDLASGRKRESEAVSAWRVAGQRAKPVEDVGPHPAPGDEPGQAEPPAPGGEPR